MKLIIDIPENVYKGAKLLDERGVQDGVVQVPMQSIAKGIPFEKFSNDLCNDVYKFQRDSLDEEYKECYHIALLEVMSHCHEVTKDER